MGQIIHKFSVCNNDKVDDEVIMIIWVNNDSDRDCFHSVTKYLVYHFKIHEFSLQLLLRPLTFTLCGYATLNYAYFGTVGIHSVSWIIIIFRYFKKITLFIFFQLASYIVTKLVYLIESNDPEFENTPLWTSTHIDSIVGYYCKTSYSYLYLCCLVRMINTKYI